ncbi:hypothetical protein DICA1_E09252 [Diutina catenulata]
MLSQTEVLGALDEYHYRQVTDPEFNGDHYPALLGLSRQMWASSVRAEPKTRAKASPAMASAAITDFLVRKRQTVGTVPQAFVSETLKQLRRVFPLFIEDSYSPVALEDVPFSMNSARERERLAATAFAGYSPQDVFSLSEVTMVHNPRTVTMGICGNIAVSEWLPPVVVSNCPVRSAEYHPQGLNNSFAMANWLAALNRRMAAVDRRIVIICHNHVVVSPRKYSHVRLHYISLANDAYFGATNPLRFPSDFGITYYVKYLLLQEMARLQMFPDDVWMDQILISYGQITDSLLVGDGKYFSQLSVMKAGWIGPVSDVRSHNPRIVYDVDSFYFTHVPVSPLPLIENYHYSVKDLYYNVALLSRYQIPAPKAGSSLSEVCQYLSLHAQPFFAQEMPEMIPHFNAFMRTLSQQVVPGYEIDMGNEKFAVTNPAHIAPVAELLQLEAQTCPPKKVKAASHLFDPDPEAEIQSAAYVGLRLPQDVDVVKKRPAEDEESPRKVKKMRMVEEMMTSRVPFVDAKGIFSDDEDDTRPDDSFDGVVSNSGSRKSSAKELANPKVRKRPAMAPGAIPELQHAKNAQETTPEPSPSQEVTPTPVNRKKGEKGEKGEKGAEGVEKGVEQGAKPVAASPTKPVAKAPAKALAKVPSSPSKKAEPAKAKASKAEAARKTAEPAPEEPTQVDSIQNSAKPTTNGKTQGAAKKAPEPKAPEPAKASEAVKAPEPAKTTAKASESKAPEPAKTTAKAPEAKAPQPNAPETTTSAASDSSSSDSDSSDDSSSSESEIEDAPKGKPKSNSIAALAAKAKAIRTSSLKAQNERAKSARAELKKKQDELSKKQDELKKGDAKRKAKAPAKKEPKTKAKAKEVKETPKEATKPVESPTEAAKDTATETAPTTAAAKAKETAKPKKAPAKPKPAAKETPKPKSPEEPTEQANGSEEAPMPKPVSKAPAKATAKATEATAKATEATSKTLPANSATTAPKATTAPMATTKATAPKAPTKATALKATKTTAPKATTKPTRAPSPPASEPEAPKPRLATLASLSSKQIPSTYDRKAAPAASQKKPHKSPFDSDSDSSSDSD